MRRQGQDADSVANSYFAAQMQHISAQRMQHNSGINNFPGRPDALPTEEEHLYASSKAEGQWQWDRDGPKSSNPMSPHLYSEGKCSQATSDYVRLEDSFMMKDRPVGASRIEEYALALMKGIKICVALVPCGVFEEERWRRISFVLYNGRFSNPGATVHSAASLDPVRHSYDVGQGGDASRSFYQGQRPDSKLGVEKQANKDPRAQAHEQDMEIGYEDNPLPQTFESLEQKFLDEIMKLTKEQSNAEDAENARHREKDDRPQDPPSIIFGFLVRRHGCRSMLVFVYDWIRLYCVLEPVRIASVFTNIQTKINEINAQYQERLTTLRTRQASRRDDFLHRESQVRKHRYQEAGMSHYPNSTGLGDPRGFSGATATAAGGEADRAFATGQFDSYRERAQFLGGSRSQGLESRGPYPGGRVYDTGSRYY
ncbi:hypothetical protein HHK36_016925 [Tetracentron sinense]|uniref:Uncharacterized protein n=1 Tax=Tetracentron sinense TaxID=13715 RepID=A0A835DF59_TETSI|nr:hypothetical protein HHK36_016925 [Tetracentron sinense]